MTIEAVVITKKILRLVCVGAAFAFGASIDPSPAPCQEPQTTAVEYADWSVFDIDAGKNSDYYLARLPKVEQAFEQWRKTNLSRQDVEFLRKTYDKARADIYTNLMNSDELSAEERDQYFSQYTSMLFTGAWSRFDDRYEKYVELKDLLLTEKAPKRLEILWLQIIELKMFFASDADSNSHTGKHVEFQRVADELVELSMTEDAIVPNLNRLLQHFDKRHEQIRDETIRKIVEQFAASGNELRQKYARSYKLNERFRELVESEYKDADFTLSDADKIVVQDYAADLIERAEKESEIAAFAPDFISEIWPFDARLAKETLEKLAEKFAKSDNLRLKNLADSYQNSIRFNDLVGSELKLQGVTLDNQDFNWESYRGKVVLVNFFEHWGGRLAEERPIMLANYEKYHDAGFEVVGYCVESNTEGLKSIQNSYKIPWTTISPAKSQNEKDEYGRYQSGPVKDFNIYSRIGNGTHMVLVGKDGKVIAVNVQGNMLPKLLKELFPEVQ